MFVCCYEFMYRCLYLNIFVNFGRIFAPATLVSCFLRMLNKQARLLLLYVKEKSSKAGRFPSWYHVLIRKTSPLRRDTTSPGRDWMKNVPASSEGNNKFIKKWLWSSDLVYCPVPLVIPSRLSYKPPLDSFIKKVNKK